MQANSELRGHGLTYDLVVDVTDSDGDCANAQRIADNAVGDAGAALLG